MTITAIPYTRAKSTTESAMDVLYARLSAVGFDRTFVRNYVLPDWWEDSLAANPNILTHAEIAIARMLGFSIDALRNPAYSLQQEMQLRYRLKRDRDVKESELRPAIALAQNLALTLTSTLVNMPSFGGISNYQQIRQDILQNATSVDLPGITKWCWQQGIIVVHLLHLPNLTKKFDGIALFCNERPVIVLASKRTSPPWLAYHLAHELGHIMEGHVGVGTTALVDSNLERRLTLEDLTGNITYDPDEISADQFAMNLLTGQPTMSFDAVYGMTADKLAAEAKRVERNKGINAGTLALIYGRSASRMGVAQNALKCLALDQGAQAIIRNGLSPYLPDELPEALASSLLLLGHE